MTRTELPGPNDWHVMPASGGFRIVTKQTDLRAEYLASMRVANELHRQRVDSAIFAALTGRPA